MFLFVCKTAIPCPGTMAQSVWCRARHRHERILWAAPKARVVILVQWLGVPTIGPIGQIQQQVNGTRRNWPHQTQGAHYPPECEMPVLAK